MTGILTNQVCLDTECYVREPRICSTILELVWTTIYMCKETKASQYIIQHDPTTCYILFNIKAKKKVNF